MAHHGIKLEGLAEFQKGLAKRIQLDDVKRIVSHNGAQLQRKAKDKAQFKGHYEGKNFVKPTGELRDSISIDIKDDGLTAVVEPTKDYAVYVEYGTRFMDSQPYLRPAYVEQLMKFKQDMHKLIN